MYSVRSRARATDEFTELSFRNLDSWRFFDTPDGPLADIATMIVLLGDDRCGPLLGFTALAPGVDCPLGPPHGHCSDNFRASLRGDLTMGRETYSPGGFRFQDGWKTYPKNNNSCGPDGGWEIEVFADRRGLRASAVIGGPELELLMAEGGRMLAAMFDLEPLVAEPAVDICGSSALVTTIGPTDNSGKLNGSFGDHGTWRSVSAATKAAVSLLGEPTRGPAVVLAVTAPNEIAFPGSRFDTEVFRLVVDGSCTIGDRSYEPGDMRIQRAATWCEPVVAGDLGLQEIVVLGDRRHAAADVEGDAWSASLDSIVAELADELAARASAPTPVSAAP